MSLKVGLQTAINISELQFKELTHIGWIRYRLSLHYTPFKSDHKIYFHPCNIDNSMRRTHLRKNEPQMQSFWACSQKFEVCYNNDAIHDGTVYFFKAYIDLLLIQKIDIVLTVELFISENYHGKFRKTHTYEAKIQKANNLFDYLPICFDNFGALSMSGTYHSALMEYKFQKNEDQTYFLEKQYATLEEYLCVQTSSYSYPHVVAFYNRYRQSLELELSSIQERLNEYSKLMLDHTKKSAYSKLNQNKKIFKIIQKTKFNKQVTLNPQERNLLSQAILEDILNIKMLIYANWNEFNQIVKLNCPKIVKCLKQRYLDRIQQRLKVHHFVTNIKNHDWTFSKYGNNSKEHMTQVQLLRKASEKQTDKVRWGQLFPIEIVNWFPTTKDSIKFFQEEYQIGNSGESRPVPATYEHIVFLVHGFQAHRNDFIEFQQCLEANHRVKVYISEQNVGKTDQSLIKMGIRLAAQVKKYLQKQKKPFKVSFIGHSMGGIIIRAAMQHLTFLNSHLHSYISICTPHLGYLYKASPLVKAGLWFINYFDSCQSMTQLTMDDGKYLRNSFLYKLSANKALNHFEKISFITSSQDQYVSYNSARAQKDSTHFNVELKNKPEQNVICEMVDNMLSQIQATHIHRVDVIFNIDKTDFDSFVGRTGHVKFLTDHHFLKQFSVSLAHLID